MNGRQGELILVLYWQNLSRRETFVEVFIIPC